MASVTGQDLINAMNLPSTVTATKAEYILDLAIDLLNVFDADLSNMSGSAGSKTVTLTSKQRGGVFAFARIVYYSFHRRIENLSISGVSLSVADLMSNPTVMQMAEKIALRLQIDDYTRIPFVVAEAES